MSVYITGCEKDAEHVFNDSPLENRYDSLSSNSNSILNNINFDQDGNILVGSDTNQIILQHAGIDYQKKISNYYNQLGDFDYWNDFYNHYGLPKWNMAIIINSTDSSKYNVIVPVIKNNDITSIIIYSTDGDKEIANIYSQEFINQIVTIENPDMEIINSYLFPVMLFQLYEYMFNSTYNEQIINWTNSALSISRNTRNNDINFRAWCIEMEIIDIYTAFKDKVTGKILYVQSKPTSTKFVYYYVPCMGPPPFNGEHDIPDDPFYNPPIPHPVGNGTAHYSPQCIDAYYDFLVEYQVRNMVENNTLVDPCDPGKTSEDIIREAICDKIKKNGINNLGSIDDLMNDIGESGEWIVVDQSILDCPNVKCILDKLIKNPLNSNAYNSICALDKSKNYKFNFKLGNSSHTTFDPKNPHDITITIDKKLCNSNDPVNIAETLLHEGTHGIIFANFSKDFDADIFNSENWNHVIDTEYDGNVHEFMTDYLLGPVCKTLWELNGKRGKPSDYWGVVLNGLYKNVDNNGNFLSYNGIIQEWINNPKYGVNPAGLNLEEWVADFMQRYTNKIQNNPNGYGLKFDCK